MTQVEDLPSKLYAITDRKLCAPQPLLEVIHELLDAGVRFFQIREKDLSPEALLDLANPVVRLCHARGAKVLINTHARVAASLGADGVHLPAMSEVVGSVRLLSRESLIVGCSTHNMAEMTERVHQGGDFLVYGPVYETGSKPGSGPVDGLEGLRRATSILKIPVYALGGILPGRVRECLRAGAYGVAVLSGMMGPGRRERARAYLDGLGEGGSTP